MEIREIDSMVNDIMDKIKIITKGKLAVVELINIENLIRENLRNSIIGVEKRILRGAEKRFYKKGLDEDDT